MGTDSQQFPLRNARYIETIANEVKRELADELNLEIIDVNHFTDKFLKYSRHTANLIISDKLHFGDVGHRYESDLLFSSINPQTFWVKEREQIDYTSQKLVIGVPEDKITMPTSVSDGFKVLANYTKDNTTDTLIFKTHVFIDSNKPMTLKAFKSDASSLTYVKLNGTIATIEAVEKTIGSLDLGLHTLEVWTGASNKVDFKGFVIS